MSLFDTLKADVEDLIAKMKPAVIYSFHIVENLLTPANIAAGEKLIVQYKDAVSNNTGAPLKGLEKAALVGADLASLPDISEDAKASLGLLVGALHTVAEYKGLLK